jgi:hypothetical protein
MARKLTFTRSGGQFEKPDYYKFFGHYASLTLSGESPVRLTVPLGEATAAIEALSKGSSLSEPKIIDAGLLRTILSRAETLSAAVPEGGGVALGDLVQAAPVGDCTHPDHNLRHLMWLVKHGFIEPVRV